MREEVATVLEFWARFEFELEGSQFAFHSFNLPIVPLNSWPFLMNWKETEGDSFVSETFVYIRGTPNASQR